VGNEVIVKAKLVDGEYRNLKVDATDQLFTRDDTTTTAITDTTVLKTDTIAADESTKVVRLASDYDLDVSLGMITGYAAARKFGANGGVGTTEEVIWSNSGVYAGFLSTAIAVRIQAGGNVNDDAAGTGAREVTVSGLDENFAEATETIATAGASASSATTTTFIRVNRLYVSACGTYSASGLDGSNIGAITVETTTPTTVAEIPVQDGQSTIGVYTVPAAKTLLVKTVLISTAGNKPVTVKMWQRLDADDITAPVQGRRLVANFGELDGSVNIPYNFNLSFAAKTDVWFTGQTASGTSQVTLEWFSILAG